MEIDEGEWNKKTKKKFEDMLEFLLDYYEYEDQDESDDNNEEDDSDEEDN
jgi:hypothetical protein